MLTEKQVIEIYRIKKRLDMDQECRASIRGMSGPISKVYGVNARTVRDIWNRKTWAYATERNDVGVETAETAALKVSYLA